MSGGQTAPTRDGVGSLSTCKYALGAASLQRGALKEASSAVTEATYVTLTSCEARSSGHLPMPDVALHAVHMLGTLSSWHHMLVLVSLGT